MRKRIIIAYLECKIISDGKEKRICIDSYFVRHVKPVNVSLLIYPCKMLENYTVGEESERGIIVRGSIECRDLIDYIVGIYRDLKSESLRLFKRMHWFNISNLIVPIRFSPLTRNKMNEYERIIGELMASTMLLDRVLGKDVFRGNYSVEYCGYRLVRLTVTSEDGKIVFSNGILGKIYTKLYSSDEVFKKEFDKVVEFKPPLS